MCAIQIKYKRSLYIQRETQKRDEFWHRLQNVYNYTRSKQNMNVHYIYQREMQKPYQFRDCLQYNYNFRF